MEKLIHEKLRGRKSCVRLPLKVQLQLFQKKTLCAAFATFFNLQIFIKYLGYILI